MAYEILSDGVYVNGTRVFVTFDADNLRFMVRSTTKEQFYIVAEQVGLWFPEEVPTQEFLDENPDVDAESLTRPAHFVEGATVKELGPFVLSPAVEEVQNSEVVTVTPAVLDPRYHVTVWMDKTLVAKGMWEGFALQWTLNGIAAASNKGEVSVEYNGVELIDPYTVASPLVSLAL